MKLGALAFLLAWVSGAWAQDAKAIVVRSVASVAPPIRLESQYTYQEREVKRDLGADGRVNATHVTVREVMYVGGKPYRRVLAKDDKELPPAEAKHEQEKLERAVASANRLKEGERARHEAEVARDRARERERLQYVPDAYDFHLLPDASINGRTVWVVEATPRPGYNGKYSALLRNTKGKIYIDKEDFTWVRLEAEALDNICLAWALARVAKGSRIVVEQTRVNEELWLPKTVEVKAVARLVAKHLRLEQEVVCSHYRKFQADSRVTAAELK